MPPSVDGTCSYQAAFVSDVTIPDDTLIAAGQPFTKTWRVRNEGTCSWGPGYILNALAFSGGSRMAAPDQAALAQVVNQGQTVDISVHFTAPAAAGTYTSEWKFSLAGAPSGPSSLGVGPSKNGPLYVRIKVGSPTPSAATSRVTFAAGATSAVVKAELKANETRGYVLAALSDQVLLATLSSPNPAKVKITAADGATLGGWSDAGLGEAFVELPATQDYTVWVTAGAQATPFNLNITIPSRISFKTGEVSSTVSGTIRSHSAVTYVVRATAGQTMTARVEGANLGLTIYGLKDGQPLVRAEGGATSFSQKLTLTQDYMVIVVPAVDTADYSLTVKVE
jgi:hypothetical protein